jgi:hypothetical protein
MASYVLVPGGGGDEWYWHRLVPALRERGHDAVARAGHRLAVVSAEVVETEEPSFTGNEEDV